MPQENKKQIFATAGGREEETLGAKKKEARRAPV